MIRFGRLNLAFALLLLLPALAAAQKDNKFTKEATKNIGLAMAKQNPADRAQLYQNALVHLKQGQEQEPNNALVWKLTGEVLAALGQLQEADAAFKKALEMHPAYAEEIEGEREAAWIDAFNAGLAKMEAKDYPGAIKALEDAQVIYAMRPEGLMNLGALYANAGELDKAEKAFRDAVEISKGPMFAKLTDEATKASWLRFRDMAALNIAQMDGQRGVEHFEAKRFDAAAAAFAKAAETNPYARDYWFNLAQAYWAQASAAEDKLEGMPAAEQAQAKQQLIKLYEDIVKNARKTRELDPNSEVLYIIEARAERMMGEYSGSEARTKEGHDKALALLTTHQDLGIDLSEIIVTAADSGAVISGKFKPVARNDKTRKLPPGTDVTVAFTILGLDGATLATQDVTLKMGESEEPTEFEAKVADVKGEIAGWKYVIKR